MSIHQRLKAGFTFEQETMPELRTQVFLENQTSLKQMLQNMYVFVHDTRNEQLWAVTPMHISKQEKESFFRIKKGYTIKVQIDKVMKVSPHETTYDSFREHLYIIVNRMRARNLAWADNKNEAIIEANRMTHLFNQLSVEIPGYTANRVTAESLYDVFAKMVPTLGDYIERFEHESQWRLDVNNDREYEQ